MSYLGRSVDAISNVEKLDNITFNGGTTYALTKSSAAFTPAGKNNILISVSGVVQQGNFSVSGSNIVFDSAVAGTETCDFIMHYGTGLITTPADDTVSTAKIQNDAVTVDKLNLISTSSVPSLEAKGTSGVTEGYIQLNCAENSHGIKLKSPPHSAGASYTLTFPNNDGDANQFLQTDGNGVLSFANAGGGKILQVQQAIQTSTVTISSPANETYSEISGLSVTVTPNSTSSKFLLMMSVAVDSNNNYPIGLHFYRDSTKISPDGASISGMTAYTTFQQPGDTRALGTQQNAQYLDSPNTSSQIVYKIFGAKPTASTTSLNVNTLGGCSSLTVFEVSS